MGAHRRYDVVVVGAGFAGLYMLYRLRELGLSARVLERGDGVGGTWYWNRYPGARCDVESMQYSYSFDHALQQEWEWTERYAGQPEILRYANHVADRYDLWSDIQFGTTVRAAHFDEAESRWDLDTDRGSFVADFVVLATGCLSSANRPTLPGMEDFGGQIHHTGDWPREGVDFTGQRVGVIGTGSSAIQAIPVIAAQASALTVFQRTANYSVPANNHTLDPAEVADVKANYGELRRRAAAERSAIASSLPVGDTSALSVPDHERTADFAKRWDYGGFTFLRGYDDLLIDGDANRHAADFVRDKIRDIVDDPAVAELLSPEQVIGCKRLCLDSGYFETYNRDHVQLVDIRTTPIESFTAAGLRIAGRDGADSTDFGFDHIVLATGFDAMTGTILKIDIRGLGGQTIQDRWSAGPVNYLGLGIAGFPNLFTVSGPGSPSVLTNMLVSIQQHVEWIAECLDHLRAGGYRRIEATAEAQADWVDHVNQVADRTLYPTCNSWYLGANIPGKTRVFMPLLGYPQYVERCDEVVAAGYEGFALS